MQIFSENLLEIDLYIERQAHRDQQMNTKSCDKFWNKFDLIKSTAIRTTHTHTTASRSANRREIKHYYEQKESARESGMYESPKHNTKTIGADNLPKFGLLGVSKINLFSHSANELRQKIVLKLRFYVSMILFSFLSLANFAHHVWWYFSHRPPHTRSTTVHCIAHLVWKTDPLSNPFATVAARPIAISRETTGVTGTNFYYMKQL